MKRYGGTNLLRHEDTNEKAHIAIEELSLRSTRQLILHQLHPERGPERQNLIVKIVVGVMQQAIAVRFAVAYPNIATGLLLQHKREILRAHAGGRRGIDALLTGNGDSSADGAGGFSGAVDRDWITGIFRIEANVGSEFEALRDTFRHMPDCVFQLFSNRIFKTAEGSPHHGAVRQCVPGIAAVNLRDADHGSVGGIDLTADDGLQLRDQIGCRHQHIVTGMWHRGMGCLTIEMDFKAIERRHHRAGPDGKVPGWHIGEIMHAEHPLRRKLIKQSLADHLMSTGSAFLRRLKNEIHGAIEAAMLRQITSRTEQHRAMTVVTTGMHFAAVAGSMIEVILLLDKQRIHIGAQRNAVGAMAPAQNTDNASSGQALMNFDASLLQLPGDQSGGCGFFKSGFGILVELSAPAAHVRMQGENLRSYGHGLSFDYRYQPARAYRKNSRHQIKYMYPMSGMEDIPAI